MICNICCDDYDTNPELNEFLTCSYCQHVSCYNCAEKYITIELKEPNCMACNKIWSREFVMEKFDTKWVKNTFLPHIGALIMEQEKMLLPDTQKEAQLVLQIHRLQDNLKKIPNNQKLERKYKNQPEELKTILEEKKNLRSEITKLQLQTITYCPDAHEHDEAQSQQKQTKKPVYILKCPEGNCRGFIEDKTFKCGICETHVCDKCHVIVPAPGQAGPSHAKMHAAHAAHACTHKCKKEDILSAQAILNETKPCPKCMSPIWKVSGCDQMFCTQCHTSFSWLTGKIENNIFHNPHFYEWLAEAGNNMNNPNMLQREEIACGELPHPQIYLYKVQQLIRNSRYKNNDNYVLTEIYRLINHINHILPNYANDRIKTNFDLRVQFLTNVIDEETWCMKLMNREKKRQKTRAIRELLELSAVILTDMVRQIMYMQLDDSTQNYQSILQQYKKLRTYHQECVDRIMITHCVVKMPHEIIYIYDPL